MIPFNQTPEAATYTGPRFFDIKPVMGDVYAFAMVDSDGNEVFHDTFTVSLYGPSGQGYTDALYACRYTAERAARRAWEKNPGTPVWVRFYKIKWGVGKPMLTCSIEYQFPTMDSDDHARLHGDDVSREFAARVPL